MLLIPYSYVIYLQSEPIKVCVTGAAGQIGYSLVYMIANGDVFGRDQKVILTLLDIEPMMGVLEGVVMELSDCAFNLLTEVIPTSDASVAFKDVSVAFMVGAMPRKQGERRKCGQHKLIDLLIYFYHIKTGMERKDLLSANVKIFKVQGEALNTYAKKDVKVLGKLHILFTQVTAC